MGIRRAFPLSMKDPSELWTVVLGLAFIVFVSQSIAGFHLSKLSLSNTLLLTRFLHAFCGGLSILLLLFFRKFWTSKRLIVLFFILVFPWYITSWYSQVVYAASGDPFIPFLPFKLYPIVLAFLVPAAYWINLCLILLFYLQAYVLWHYIDLPNLKNIVVGSEPLVTILFALVSFILLFFRYRDEKHIRELSIEKANAEEFEKVAKIFLSVRDRANTPLQAQKILHELLQQKFPQENDLIPKLRKSTEELATMMELLRRFQTGIDYGLMTDDEILSYVQALESAKRKRN